MSQMLPQKGNKMKSKNIKEEGCPALRQEDVDRTIEISHKHNVFGMIDLILDACGAKKTLLLLAKACIVESGHKCIPPSSFLATEKDAENLETAMVIRHVLDNWKELCKKGLKDFEKRQKEFEKNKKEEQKNVCT